MESSKKLQRQKVGFLRPVTGRFTLVENPKFVQIFAVTIFSTKSVPWVKRTRYIPHPTTRNYLRLFRYKAQLYNDGNFIQAFLITRISGIQWKIRERRLYRDCLPTGKKG